MSDPVTNVEIEDVLSSIRRLVSEDARVRPLPVRLDAERLADYAEVEGTSAQNAKADKLVLTPALRVADSRVDDEAESAPDIAQDMPPHDDITDAQPDVAQDEPISDAAPDGFADDTTDQPIAHETAQDDAGSTDDASLTLTWEDHEGEAAASAPSPEAYTADNFLSDIMDMVGATPEPAAITAKDGEGFVFSSTRDDPRPDSADRSKDKAADDRVADDKAASQSLFEDEDTFLDEDTLREMVTDIVRQELQGALGERITRNVRKLVRREIHRALTSHELD